MIPQTELSLVEKTQIINAFWSAPDDASFPASVVSVVLDSTESSLASMRSRGVGPRFLSSGGGKRILYTKAEVKAWIGSRMVSANNCAQAKALEIDLHDLLHAA